MQPELKPRGQGGDLLITRREKRVLRKLLYLELFPTWLGDDANALTRLANINKEMVDRMKLADLIELTARVLDGRLDWHVRLSSKGRELAQTLGAMRPVGPLPSPARRLQRAAELPTAAEPSIKDALNSSYLFDK